MFDLLSKLMLTDIVCLLTCMLVLAILNDVRGKSKFVKFAYESAGWLAVFYVFMLPFILVAMIWTM